MHLLYIVAGLLVIFLAAKKKKPAETATNWQTPGEEFPAQWRVILLQKVAFYNGLSDDERPLFEFKVREFLANCRITGVQVEVDDTDRLLVASSAVIPIFGFPDWTYTNLFEVLLYPSSFDEKFQTAGPGRNILGMVGTGYMDGKMILSKPALHHGFSNETDKRNTGVHEFIHLIDKMDSTIDGLPAVLMERQYAIPWLSMVEQKMAEIQNGKSDVNDYGGTSRIEFFAVIGEYFFEKPQLLAQKHPELYDMLEQMFRHDMKQRNFARKKFSIGRNDPCPCGSGMKFKKCCGGVHYAR